MRSLKHDPVRMGREYDAIEAGAAAGKMTRNLLTKSALSDLAAAAANMVADFTGRAVYYRHGGRRIGPFSDSARKESPPILGQVEDLL